MEYLDNKTLRQIEGGVDISGTLINSFSKIIEVVLGIGRSLGSAIRRINDGNICPLG